MIYQFCQVLVFVGVIDAPPLSFCVYFRAHMLAGLQSFDMFPSVLTILNNGDCGLLYIDEGRFIITACH